MSILIKGMDMPKEGGVVVIYKEGNSFYTTKAGEGRRYPLIHVSPHGRLIDADELETDTEWDMYLDDFISYSGEQIKIAPTIIEAEKGEPNA